MKLALQAMNIFMDGSKHAGVSRTSLQLLEAILRRTDHQYIVFTRPEFVIPDHWKNQDHITVVPTWTRTRTWHLIGREFFAMKYRPDAWFSVSGYVPRLPGLIKGSLVHDIFYRTFADSFTEEDRLIHEAMSLNIARNSTFIAANSDATIKAFSGLYQIPEERFFKLPFGIGQAIEGDPIPVPGLKPQSYILALSTLEPRKNFPRLLEAYAKLIKERPDLNLDLVIAGGKGWKENSVYESIENLGIASRIKFTGYVPDGSVPWLFQNARLAATVSLDEGFGVPVLEAMTFGSPLVCSNAPALKEVGGNFPTYVNPLDVQSIYNGIEFALAQERDERKQLGKDRSSLFSWDQSAIILLDQLKRVTSKANARST
jgi:glycosyltransferase involved in cell wall biosynthesis